MPRGNLYLSKLETKLCLGAVEAMLESLPAGEVVPDVDRKDAERDRLAYEALRQKLADHC